MLYSTHSKYSFESVCYHVIHKYLDRPDFIRHSVTSHKQTCAPVSLRIDWFMVCQICHNPGIQRHI